MSLSTSAWILCILTKLTSPTLLNTLSLSLSLLSLGAWGLFFAGIFYLFYFIFIPNALSLLPSVISFFSSTLFSYTLFFQSRTHYELPVSLLVIAAVVPANPLR